MDRRTVYAGQLPLEADLLVTGQNAMVGLAKLTEATLGTDTVADGFALTPTVPLSLAVNLSPGSIYQQVQLEQSAWSSLPPDVRQIVKQGIELNTQTIPLSAPPTVGFAWNVLIQVQYGDDDDGEVVRPYYNAGNPAVPFSGPGNSNTEQPTSRRGTVVVNPKYGPSGPSGNQATPTPDPGWIGLYVVTVPNGSTQITGGLIATYTNAATVVAKLPKVPSSIQNNLWTFVADTSVTPNLITGSPSPAIKAYQTAAELKILVGNTNTDAVTINISGLGSRPLTRRDGTPLIAGDILKGSVVTVTDDGVKYRLASLAQGEVPRIVPNAVLWVRTDGDDNNDGSANTALTAFKTIAAAVARASISFITGGSGTGLTIQMGIPGTYTAPTVGLRPNGNVTILGDLANQGAYIIQGGNAGTQVVGVAGGGSLTLNGLTLQNIGSTQLTLNMNGAVNVILRNVTFAAVLTLAVDHLAVGVGTVLTVQAGCIFSGNARSLWFAVAGSIYMGASVVTIVGNPTFSSATVVASDGGRIISAGGSFVGTAVGTRYSVAGNAVINTIGGGVNFFPGTAAGSVATGGQYA